MYAREVDGQELKFGVSGKLIMNALVMYDRETDSLWSQFTGEAVEGPLAGARLELIPAQLVTWRAWKEQHPDTLALEKVPYGEGDAFLQQEEGDEDFGGFTGDFNPYLSYYLSNRAGVHGENNVDKRLATKELVVGIEGERGHMAYSFRHLKNTPVVNDAFEGRDLVVALNVDTLATGVYLRKLDGRTLTFDQSQDALLMTDRETRSTWEKSTGEAVSGRLTGKQLEKVHFFASFWFAWTDFHPETALYEPPAAAS